ncbi:MAG: phage baseplate assembly protein V [Oscillospiraceae bacterium]|nr:phage baseplate assembly protein V [Oscillospiraceae bacterium]
MLDDIANMLTDDDPKQSYIMLGTVIANYNPLKPACVQVSLNGKPIGMGVTAWAKVAMPAAASGCGIYSLPDIGDHVVVAFLDGEIDSPVVIGSLYNGTALPPTETMTPLNNIKEIKTKLGNEIKIDEMNGIEIKSITGQKLELSDTALSAKLSDPTGQTIVEIKNGVLTLNGLTGIKMKSGSCEISLDGASQSVTIKGLSVSVEAVQGLTLKGTQTDLNGQIISVSANAQLDLSSTGATNVKGSILKLN